jgi:hypothetical protein
VVTPISSQLDETIRFDALPLPEPRVDKTQTPAAGPVPGATAEAPPQLTERPEIRPIPRAADAAEVLRQRLTELYAFRWWRDRPAGVLPPLPSEVELPSPPDLPGDLTSRTEAQFSPGYSSSLLGSAGPKKPTI